MEIIIVGLWLSDERKILGVASNIEEAKNIAREFTNSFDYKAYYSSGSFEVASVAINMLENDCKFTHLKL